MKMKDVLNRLPILKRFDAYSDPLTARGSSTDKTVRTKGKVSTNANAYNLGLYMANGFMQNIVDFPAQDATREWITIKTDIDGQEEETEEEKDASAIIENRLKEVGLQDKITELIRYSRMYSKGAFLYYGIIGDKVQNKEVLNKPLPGKIQSIDYINVIDDPDRVSITVLNKSDPLVKDFHKPVFRIGGYEIHNSRLSWLVNSFIPDQQTGISVVQTVEDGVKAQDSGLWSTNSILSSMALKIFVSDEIAGLSVDQKAELLAKIKHLLDTQSVMALKQDEDFKQLIYNITGIKEIFDYVFDNLSGLARIPKKILLGQAHGIVTGAEYDTMNYYNDIARFQEIKLRPIIQKVINLVRNEVRGEFYQQFGEKKDIQVDFEFNSLWELSPTDMAETDLKNAQRDQIDQAIGKTNAAELRSLDCRYKELGEFVMDRNNLNPDDMELPEEFKKWQEEQKKPDTDRNNKILL